MRILAGGSQRKPHNSLCVSRLAEFGEANGGVKGASQAGGFIESKAMEVRKLRCGTKKVCQDTGIIGKIQSKLEL